MKKLIGFFKGYAKESFLAPIFKMLEAIFELIVPLVVSDIIDNGIKNNDSKRIYAMGGIMLLLAVIGLVCAISAQYFAAKAAVGVSSRLRSSLFYKIESLSYTQYDKIGTSTLITRLTGDVNTVQNGINLFLRLFMRSPFIVFGAMIMAFTIDTNLALIFLVAIIILSIVVFGIMLVSIPLYKKVQIGVDNVLHKTRSNYRGTRVIRAFNRQDKEIEDFKEKHSTLTKIQLFAGKISALMNPLTYVIINIAIIFLVKLGALRVDSGDISQGQLVALYNYMTQILVELIKLANLIITLTKAMAGVKRINTVLDSDSDVKHTPNKETIHTEDVVVFDNVSFRYSDGGDDALSGISFSVKKGQTIGIIGGTGSGKSTLVNLIPGFYKPSGGGVFVDGKNTCLWDNTSLLSKFGVVSQKAALFSGTIRSNVSLGAEGLTDDEVWGALTIAQAKDFVTNKEGMLDSEVTQNGSNLSGGQKQRITIARALARKPEILIFDDSSSALDYSTESALRSALTSLKWEPTVFIISQRASSVMSADNIIVLDDGAVVGMGDHNSLLETCEIYKEIYQSQFGDDEQ